MEYGINKNIKYTTLQIRSILLKEIKRKQRKWHRRESPQGGWGMGSKEPIPKMILLQKLKYKRNDKSELYWSLYRLKPSFYNFAKQLIFFWRKGIPMGGFERS